MRYPSEEYILREQQRIIEDSSGMHGVRDMNMLLSAIGQPQQSFGGVDLYPDIISKSAALGYFLIRNHPFVDGNKRIGHAMMEWTLRANRYELQKDVDEQEAVILKIAAGEMTLEEVTSWLHSRCVQI